MARMTLSGGAGSGRGAAVSAFALAVTRDLAVSDAGLSESPHELEAYVARRSTDLTSATRLGITAIELALGAAVRLIDRRGFADLDSKRRRQWINRWDRSRLAPIRQYVRFHRSLILLWAFENQHAASLEDHR